MAISYTHYQILKTLKERDVLLQHGRILEIGEANWYGDFDPQEIFDAAGERCDPKDTFAVAKLIYKEIFSPIGMVAFDANGPTAKKIDLNLPVASVPGRRVHEQFDVTYNHGTAEHVFNIAQVFRTMHDATIVGGLLIHESPFTGWLDHGFYCLQPTLFYDVAAANGYVMEFVAIEHLASRTWQEVPSRDYLLEMKRRGQLADNLMLFVVMCKTGSAEFQVPMQGVYAGTVSDEARKAWRELR